jgi:hypothetical protein
VAEESSNQRTTSFAPSGVTETRRP